MSNIPIIHSEYSSTYKRINVAGIFGGIVPGGLDAIIYSEDRMAEKVLETQPPSPNKVAVKRIVEVDLIIDPMQMKVIHRWLEQKIVDYERIFGNIPSPAEIENRTRRNSQQ